MITHRHSTMGNGRPYVRYETFDVLDTGRLVAVIQCLEPGRASTARDRTSWMVWRAAEAGPQLQPADYVGTITAPTPSQASRLAVDLVRDGANPPPPERNTPMPETATQRPPAPPKTLRDEFAMAALAALGSHGADAINNARVAYMVADAMLMERQK